MDGWHAMMGVSRPLNMSLIRVRRQRKRDWIDAKKGKSPTTLAILFAVALAIIWYLGRAF